MSRKYVLDRPLEQVTQPLGDLRGGHAVTDLGAALAGLRELLEMFAAVRLVDFVP